MSVDYRPNLGNYKSMKPFFIWCQKVLPLVYDDSLSYYEVLEKVVAYLNTVIENLDTTEENIQLLSDAYDELQDYVNHYFDNLDVQEEIDAKLDTMASDGTLTTLIEPYMEELNESVIRLTNAVGSPLVAETASAMTDRDKIYVYVGSESGYVNGNWYYFDGTIWESGGVYNSVAFVTDKTLTVEGMAADAKATGEIRNMLLNGTMFVDVGETPNGYFNGSEIVPDSSHGFSYTHITNTKGYVKVEFETLTQNSGLVFVKENGSFTGYGGNVGTYSIDLSHATEIYLNFFGDTYCEGFDIYTVSGVGSDIPEEVNVISGRFVESRNIYNPNDVTLGKRIFSNGTIGNETGYQVTGMLKAESNEYYCNATVCHYACYDANGNYINNSYGFWSATVGDRQVIPIPVNAVYFRISPYYTGSAVDAYTIDGSDYFYLCKSSEDHNPMSYDAFTMPGLILESEQGEHEGVVGYNYFTVDVDNSDVGSGSGDTSQSNTNIVAVNAVIRLPSNYNNVGQAIPCIMICHGAGYGVGSNQWGYYDSGGVYGDQTNFVALQNAFINKGFAVMDINGSENITPFYSWGCRRAIDAYKKLYDYAVNHFNILPQIGIYGFSMGALVALNFVDYYRDVVSVLALGCPCVSLYGSYKYAIGFRRAIASTYDFEGTAPTWTENYSTAEDDYYQSNIAKTYGQDPEKRILTIATVDKLTGLPPVRIWLGGADDAISQADITKFSSAVLNGGGRVSVRTVDGEGHRTCYGGLAYINAEIADWLNRML